MMARVLDDGEPSEAFPVANGVKQGCVLAPTLFSLMFSAILSDAFKKSELGINIKFMQGVYFNANISQLQRKTHTNVTLYVIVSLEIWSAAYLSNATSSMVY